MRFVWAAVAAIVAGAAAWAAVCASAALAGVGDQPTQVDYGIRLAGPVDTTGKPTRTHVTAGVPFLLRVELYADTSQGGASVAYDLDLPTGVSTAARPERLRTGELTSSCLRACTVGWNAAQTRRLFVYYAFVTPGPGEFIIQAGLESTNRSDARSADNSGSVTITAIGARLALGRPLLAAGPPQAGRSFDVTVPVRRGGVPVRPARATCVAAIDGVTLDVAVSLDHGGVRCAWRIPHGSAGKELRTTVHATAGPLRVSGTWVYAIRRS